VALIAIVILQSGKTSGLSGALSGGSDTFLSRNKSKSLDARLARATKWFAVAFVVLTVVLNMTV
jgi:preprotein translocase subunit SecG